MVIEIVDLLIKNGGHFHSYVNAYQRVYHGYIKFSDTHITCCNMNITYLLPGTSQ